MKLNKKQFETLKTSVESLVSGLVENVISDTSDEYHRERVLEMLPENEFTDDEVDEIREIWNDDENGREIDNTLMVNFVEDVVNSIMEKYK